MPYELWIRTEIRNQFGWLQGSRKLLTEKKFWLRGPAAIRVLPFRLELIRLAA
jgi:hypothetical protein